ncbi:MAG: hypothetical protein KKB81_04045 [Candidatus Margulisbacteria bacterium]|nr:hypothetical protein [Candidatus Margulisiibacteriota bacterium]MBU1021087.1 hypothetical protein [Candidatus Margulisiibacteriota bacterium]MBU1729896.1 hypothetical protein [Candidatus Margulisiibacteriota bacterium]MBU1955226.1 hypothetical protein [Candidatus Margulisiibacteriota bacterium]
MKIGEVFKYKVNGRTQIIRKEKDYYIAHNSDEMATFLLDEISFQVLKHTINNSVERCKASLAKKMRISLKMAGERIKRSQQELRASSFLGK